MRKGHGGGAYEPSDSGLPMAMTRNLTRAVLCLAICSSCGKKKATEQDENISPQQAPVAANDEDDEVASPKPMDLEPVSMIFRKRHYARELLQSKQFRNLALSIDDQREDIHVVTGFNGMLVEDDEDPTDSAKYFEIVLSLQGRERGSFTVRGFAGNSAYRSKAQRLSLHELYVKLDESGHDSFLGGSDDGDPEGAARRFAAAVALAKEAGAQVSADELARSQLGLGASKAELKDFAGAALEFARARQAINGPKPNRWLVAIILGKQGEAYNALKRPRDAIRVLELARQEVKKSGQDGPEGIYLGNQDLDIPWLLIELGKAYQDAGKEKLAIDSLRAAKREGELDELDEGERLEDVERRLRSLQSK